MNYRSNSENVVLAHITYAHLTTYTFPYLDTVVWHLCTSIGSHQRVEGVSVWSNASLLHFLKRILHLGHHAR